MFLSEFDFSRIVRQTPLVSIDLCILKNNKILVGKRINSPAKDFFFVPGGRIYKSELRENTLKRVLRDELGYYIKVDKFESILEMGSYEHFYDDNFLGNKNFNTHYIVLAYLLPFEILQKNKNLKISDQHTQYKWIKINEVNKKCKNIHQNTLNYLKHPIFQDLFQNNNNIKN